MSLAQPIRVTYPVVVRYCDHAELTRSEKDGTPYWWLDTDTGYAHYQPGDSHVYITLRAGKATINVSIKADEALHFDNYSMLSVWHSTMAQDMAKTVLTAEELYA